MSLLSAELSATCNALGYYDQKTNKYYADENTLETIKDLIRYLRRDDETHEVRRQLGETKVLQTDLLPLLKNYWKETDLFDVLLRLLVNLTTPPLMLWNQELPSDKSNRNLYLQIEDHLRNYKEYFVDHAIWAVLSTRLSNILDIDYAERGDENSLIIERILLLIRNILSVYVDCAEKRPDNDANVHDQVLWALHQSGLLDILLYMSSTINEQVYYFHILEIMSFMLRGQKASELANANLQRSHMEKVRDEAELLSIRYKETNQRQQKMKMYTGTRHSRFGGTFVVKSMKSISENDLICHKPLNNVGTLNFDANKTKPKTPKNRTPIINGNIEQRSAFGVRLCLKDFCVEFLNGAYNTFMYHVKNNLLRSKAQDHDESYYLWALRFFMEFNRCNQFEVKLVSETMSVQAFHYVQQQCENYFDILETDRKNVRLWARRLHLAVLAYRELFYTLYTMDKSPDGSVRDSSKVIKNNIFYVLEYREFILSLLVTYDELKMSDTYLKDLIETQHIFLKLLEGFCGTNGMIVVQKKKRRRAKLKKKATTEGAKVVQSAEKDLNLEGRWNEASPQLSIVLENGSRVSDIVPFDPISEVPVEEQKTEAMKNIQRKLRNGEYETAVSLLRASREVWPENDCFGSNNMAAEEEFLALRDIFFADLGENQIEIANKEINIEEENEDEYEEDEEDEIVNQFQETSFKLEDFLKRLANPKIIRACGLALKNFENNSVNTNHCIIKLLHRIAFDCKMYVMLFQVSIFQTFQKIFTMKELPQYKELVKFSIYIIRQFFKVAEINKKVFMEALFWKSSREAYDIEQGYGSYQGNSAAAAKAWSEQEEDELRRLFMEHQENQINDDVVDWIVDNLIDNTRSRRMVLKKLKEMFLLTDYKRPSNSSKSMKIPQTWSSEEETQLRELYEEFKDSIDPLGCIMDRLDIKRPRNRLIEKLLLMGLVKDRKELRKKRAKKAKSQNYHSNDDVENSSSGCSDSDDNNINVPGNSSSTSKAILNPTNKNSRRKKIPEKNKRKRTKVASVSLSQLTERLINIMNSEMSEALEWVKESLYDAIEDFEDGNDEGIPLVPIMDYAVNAMESNEFQQMLEALGLCKPFDEQETYWRIPTTLSVEILKRNCGLLQEAIDKTLKLPTEQLPPSNVDSDGSSDEEIFDKLKKMMSPNAVIEKREKPSRIIQEESDDENNETFTTGENEETNEVQINTTETFNEQLDEDSNAGEVRSTKKITRIIDSDSETETINENIDINNTSDLKRIRTFSDSDSENVGRKRSRIIDSDEDD